MTKKQKFFLLLSFLEGSAVMGAELLGAKMMAPFFGSSLYVWSAVMAITLGGLAGGYFFGGVLSAKKNPEITLYRILVLAAAFTILMPYTAHLAFALFGSANLLVAVILSSMLLLLPPVFFMGMVSPLIIRNLTTSAEDAGRVSGMIYALSTVGGILATFTFGFYIIPTLGLSKPAIFTGLILGLPPFVALFLQKKKPDLFFLIVAVWGLFTGPQTREQVGPVKIIYSSNGLLGQIIVVDYPVDFYLQDSTRKGEVARWMFVNRISQTMYVKEAREENGEEKYFTYVYTIRDLLKEKPKKDKEILLLGLGGGSIASVLHNEGYNVDVCELDPRIAMVARTYFGLPEEVDVSVDDARHYLRICKKKYDAVIMDTFKGEETPSHVLTRESLKEINSILKDDGLLIVNGSGYWTGKRGKGMRSIAKTLEAGKWKTMIIPTEESQDMRNLEFVATKGTLPEWTGERIQPSAEELQNAVVLTDEIPLFEKLNGLSALSWRSMAIRSFSSDDAQRALPIFE